MSDEILEPNPAPPRRRSIFPLALMGLVLIAAVAAWWWLRGVGEISAEPAVVAPMADVEGQPDRLSTEIKALHARLEDAAKVNRSLREQLLGLTQRVGLLEDGLTALERGAAPGLDSLRLEEADYLLRLGEERLQLFGDVNAARVAFDLADAQLSQVAEPGVTSVRQTLTLERDALAAVASVDLPPLLARLDALADSLPRWKLKGGSAAVDKQQTENPNWMKRFGTSLDGYFRVRRVDPNEGAHGGPLLRERLSLELARARMLLLRSEGAAALRAIEKSRRVVADNFEASDPPVAEALAILDALRAAPLAPSLPTLGESRRELGRLREGANGAARRESADSTAVIEESAPPISPEPDLPAEASPEPLEAAPEPILPPEPQASPDDVAVEPASPVTDA